MKFLKNILLTVVTVSLIFSCNPLDDVYEEIDVLTEAEGPGKGTTIAYTLSAEDYGTIAGLIEENGTVADTAMGEFVEDNEAFSTDIGAKDFLPGFVNESYPQLGKGTAVQVTYNFYNADIPDYDAYIDAFDYELDTDDYAAVSTAAGSAGFFDNQVDVASILPGILGTQVQDPIENDIVSITYDYVSVAYEDLAGETVFTEGFTADLNGFESISLVGDDQVWAWGTFGGATYARMSGFSGGAVVNEDWLVSPEINLTANDGDVSLFLTQILNFQGDSEWGDHLDILFSTNYTGDVAAATWTSVGTSQSALPPGNTFDEFDNEVALPGAGGNTIHLAFSYKSTADFAALWEIVDIRIDLGAAPDTDEANIFYQYDGSEWNSLEDEVTFLGSADYDAMGESSGQPGRFNNFSSSTPSGNYLPEFLASKISFAQEGDTHLVVFRFFSGSTVTLAETYTFTDGAWAGSFFVEKTDQFVHDGTEFVFDPSVTLTMVSADYQLIVDEVATTNPDLVNSFGSGEDFYGADAFFENFDIRLSSKTGQSDYDGLSTSEAEALALQRAGEGVGVFLESRFSEQAPVEGVDVFYTVEIKTFDGNDAFWSVVYQLTSVGTFEYVEGPTPL